MNKKKEILKLKDQVMNLNMLYRELEKTFKKEIFKLQNPPKFNIGDEVKKSCAIPEYNYSAKSGLKKDASYDIKYSIISFQYINCGYGNNYHIQYQLIDLKTMQTINLSENQIEGVK
jgi:hypothetical protein